MPDFAMRYQRNMRTFEMERGFLAVAIMDMYGAGRIGKKNRGRGLTEHTALHVLPMPQLYFSCSTCRQLIGWAAVLTKLALFWVSLRGFSVRRLSGHRLASDRTTGRQKWSS
jgi:hypothetical protein